MKLFLLAILCGVIALLINGGVLLLGVENDIIIYSVRFLTVIGLYIFMKRVYWDKRQH